MHVIKNFFLEDGLIKFVKGEQLKDKTTHP